MRECTGSTSFIGVDDVRDGSREETIGSIGARQIRQAGRDLRERRQVFAQRDEREPRLSRLTARMPTTGSAAPSSCPSAP